MPPSENKALIRRFYEEAWGPGEARRHRRGVRERLRPSRPSAHAGTSGPQGQKRITADFRGAFPNLRFEVEILIAEDEFVAARWTATGTHSGRWGTVEPTGRMATLSGVNVFRFEQGKVAELWNHRDDLGLMEQLGAVVYAGARPEA